MSAGAPERIVCLTEETTETLYLLGEEHRIAGISGYRYAPWRRVFSAGRASISKNGMTR